MTGNYPTNYIDHKDRDVTNNSWDNLREATPQQNIRNRGVHRNSKSGAVGIMKRGSAWRAYVTEKGKRIYLGTYATIEEAYAVRLAGERKYYGEFAPQENLSV